MNLKTLIRQVFLVILPFLQSWVCIASVSSHISDPPKNIIIMISDGCGYNQILATDFYQHGRAESQVYESFPVRYGMSTFPASLSVKGPMINPETGYLTDSAWSDFNYVGKGWTDSAPAASTLACGKKTYNGAIGMDPDFKPMYSITERAKDLGKAAGVVTSVQLSHATPAGFSAHNISRSNYSEIAREMILDTRLDVIMGCGNPDFNDNGVRINTKQEYKYVGGKACWDSLQTKAVKFAESSKSGKYEVQDVDGDQIPDPWTLIQQRKDFQQLQQGETPKRVIGVPEIWSTLQQSRGGKTDTLIFAIPLISTVPTLKEMTVAALNVLSKDADGFFLMVEGGAIDWANHDNQKARMIEEEAGFNEAVEAVVAWIEKNGGWKKNLLVVTADHESGYLTGPKSRDNSPVTNPVVNKGKGNIPEMKYNNTDHSNQLVPFFAKGRGSEEYHTRAIHKDLIRGYYIDNTDVTNVFFKLWPLK